MPFTRPCLKRSIHAGRGIPHASRPYNPEHTVSFHYGRERGVLLEDVDETQMLLLSLLNGQHSFDEIVTRLQHHDPGVTAEEVSEILDQLTHYGLLEDASILPPADFTPGYLERYTSQFYFLSLLDDTGTKKYLFQARLKKARVAVLGLGGLGCHVLSGLAAIGVGFLRGVDYDHVELGNLNRQTLYDITDIGKAKALAASEHLKRFNPEITFEAVQQRIKGPDDIRHLIHDVDLVAFCADLPREIHFWMNQASLETGIPFITGGYRGIVAEVGPFVLPYQTACLQCNMNDSNDTNGHIAELAWIEDSFWLRHPNIHFLTALAANLICGDICKYIIGTGQPATSNNLYKLDIEQFTLNPYALPRVQHCRACGQGRPLAPTSTREQ